VPEKSAAAATPAAVAVVGSVEAEEETEFAISTSKPP
jgi:hypothetical protein